ncbi:unnamed protein product, partial [Durusdinium trenchii]
MATFRSRHLQYYLAMLLPTLRKKKLCEMDEDLTLWVESPPLSLLVSKGFTGLMAFGTQEILSEVDAASEAPDPTASDSVYDPEAKRREEEEEKRRKEEEEQKQRELEAARAEQRQQEIEE